uniref:Uncharacterized protein n=1 Tax=Salvator merianae TaxID=96440 RepID=A0A8D0BX74_SALMN
MAENFSEERKDDNVRQKAEGKTEKEREEHFNKPEEKEAVSVNENKEGENILSSDDEICEAQGKEMLQSDNIPVTFIVEHYEYSDENAAINDINNEVAIHSLERENSCEYEDRVEKSSEFQDSERDNIERESQEGFHKNVLHIPATSTKTSFSSHGISHRNKVMNSNLDVISENDSELESESGLEKDCREDQNSKNSDFADYQNTGKEQYIKPEEPEEPICGLLFEKNGASEEKNLSAFQPIVKEESSAEDEDDDQFFSKPGDKNLASNESSQHWNPSQDDVKNEKPDESQLKTAKADLKHDAVPHLLKTPKSREKQNADLMEELGLDGADDIEDGSDWDSTSISLGPDDKSFNFVGQKDDATSLHLNYNTAVKSSVTEKAEFSDPQTITPKDLQHNEPKGIKAFEKDKSKEKNKIGRCNSVEKRENQTVKVEITHTCDEKKTTAVIRSENSDIEYNRFDATHWEERYEKMWVANEKKEVKTNFKSITAELKQLFGENHVDKKTCDTYLEKRSQDGFSVVSEDRKESQVSHMSEASIGIEGKSDTGEIKYFIAEKESSTVPSVLYPPSSDSGKLLVKPGEKGKPNIKQNWSTDNQILASNAEGAKINQNEERCDNIFEQPKICKDRRTPSSGNVRTLASGHSSNETVLNTAFKSAYVKQPIVTDSTSMNFVTTKSTRQKTQDHFTNSVNIHKDIDTKSGNNLKNSEQTFHQTPKKELDEELEQDVARFKKEVEQQKGKQRLEVEAVEINEAVNTKKKISLNTEEKMEQKPVINEIHMKTESEAAKQSQESNIISAGNTKELIPFPLKGQPAKPATGKDKIHRTVGVKDEFDDFSHSSDTATEDIEFPNLVYGKAMLLLEQLSLESKDSVSLLKIQNIFHGYERLIEDEKGRCSQLLGKVKKLENEKKEQQRRLEDMRETKSTLEHQTTERENVISNLK